MLQTIYMNSQTCLKTSHKNWSNTISDPYTHVHLKCNFVHRISKRWQRKTCDPLTLKAPITTAADDIYKYFFFFFSEKIRLDISCQSSARQRIHMKHQAIFPQKDKSKKIKCRLLQFLLGALRVETYRAL